MTQRTNEIGVRMALGARSWDILLSIGTRGVMLTLTGLGLGLTLALLAQGAMQTLFYNLPPDYLSAAAVASAALLGVAAPACFVPARRASRIDPVVALQHE